MTSTLGWHWLFDGYDARRDRLADRACLIRALDALPDRLGLTKVSRPHCFAHEEAGAPALAGVVLLAESHLGLHTFPQSGVVSCDLFSCRPFAVSTARVFMRETFDVQAHHETLLARSTSDEGGRWASLMMELDVVDATRLVGAGRVSALARGVGRAVGVRLPGAERHSFTPHGESCCRFGGAGRVVVHTWPERHIATIDVWASQERLEARRAALIRWLSERYRLRVVSTRLHAHPFPSPAGAPPRAR